MEWKHEYDCDPQTFGNSLETFLGGMETSKEPDPVIHGFPSLETFLGGMETRRARALANGRRCLETFLGGMET